MILPVMPSWEKIKMGPESYSLTAVRGSVQDIFSIPMQLMTTEDWHNVYHTSSRAWLRVPWSVVFTPVYFTSAIMLGGCIPLITETYVYYLSV